MTIGSDAVEIERLTHPPVMVEIDKSSPFLYG